MNPTEAATVLAVAGAYDSRLTPPSADDAKMRSLAWSSALDSDMPVDWARQSVTRHYAESTKSIMPADLNTAWRKERIARLDADREARRNLEIEEAKRNAVPMPDDIRLKIEALRKKTIPNE